MGSEEKRSTRWSAVTQPFFVLTILAVAIQLSSLAYTVDKSFVSILGPSLLVILALTIPTAWFGLFVGPRIGLGAPMLIDLLSQNPGAGGRFFTESKIAIGLGLAVGIPVLLLNLSVRSYLPVELPALGHRGVLGGLLVSINAAVSEEIWTRLGLLTLLSWIFVRLLKHKELTAIVAWPIIVVSAVVFGLLHLPQLAAAGAASPIGMVGTVLGIQL